MSDAKGDAQIANRAGRSGWEIRNPPADSWSAAAARNESDGTARVQVGSEAGRPLRPAFAPLRRCGHLASSRFRASESPCDHFSSSSLFLLSRRAILACMRSAISQKALFGAALV